MTAQDNNQSHNSNKENELLYTITTFYLRNFLATEEQELSEYLGKATSVLSPNAD